jgi:exoribonuclease-2
LSFKIKLDDNYEIENCEIFITSVKVKCITYEEADKLKDSSELKPLFEITKKLKERRIKNGAVEIKMPEVKISIDKDSKKVSISPYKYFISNDVVKESMILAGEAAAKFAFKNNIPFPFISQDAPNIPSEIPSGYAGQYKLRRCMRKRNVQVTPSAHAAMGLSMYSQVTSPLRRYSDLLAHEQLRAFITGKPMINKDDMLIRMSEGDESARAAKLAERNSRLHWTLVYLLQNPDWEEDAICIEKQQKQDLFLIPSLGIETCIAGTNCELNDSIRVKIGKIDLPSLEVIFRKV